MNGARYCMKPRNRKFDTPKDDKWILHANLTILLIHGHAWKTGPGSQTIDVARLGP